MGVLSVFAGFEEGSGQCLVEGFVEVPVEKCREDAVIPAYARPGDAGMDVCCAVETVICPGETKIVPTGLKFAIPNGYEIQVRPRSGLSLKTPLRISNSPGTIDSGYRDELGIIVTNTAATPTTAPAAVSAAAAAESGSSHAAGSYTVRKGDRIAQIVLHEVPRMKLLVVDSVAGIGNDRGGGFGSTGF